MCDRRRSGTTSGRERRMLRRVRAGCRSRCPMGSRGRCARTRSWDRVPGLPAGGWGALAGVAAMPGVTPGAGPNGSVWMWEASPQRRRAAHRPWNGAGPHRYAWPSRGGSSSASCAPVRRPVRVEVAAFDVFGTWTAVVHVGACVRERGEKSPPSTTALSPARSRNRVFQPRP